MHLEAVKKQVAYFGAQIIKVNFRLGMLFFSVSLEIF